MLVRVPRWFPVALIAVGSASIGLHAQKASAPDVLQAAADYLVQYSQKLSAVTAEEQYTQYDTSSGQMSASRRLTADVVFVGLAGGSIAGFRDVFAIDSKAVRQRDERLLTLFKPLQPSSMQQATELSDASVRQYLHPNLHVLDEPTLALEFLRKENQERSTFKVESVKTMGGAQVAILKFTERSSPRLVPSAEDAPAVGRFWVDVASGTVRQTELAITGRASSATTAVKYALEPAIGLWLPIEMTQQSQFTAQGSGSNNMGSGGGYGGRLSLEGRASYAHFRR